MSDHSIYIRYLSQEDLIEAGCFDFPASLKAAEEALVRFKNGGILFPDKTVQIFKEETQERINILPATLLKEQINGLKNVSVFPMNPRTYGTQNLSATILLSKIDKGYPVCVMDGTLVSNLRVACVGATAAKYLSRENSETIGFIGSGIQARNTLLGMKSVRPSLKVCKVSSQFDYEEKDFIDTMQPLLPDMKFVACGTDNEKAARESDIVCTAVSCQAPLLKAAWIDTKAGVFYNHIGGWEDEVENVLQADKLVTDSWHVVKHRGQTACLAYKQGLIDDNFVYCDLVDIVDGTKPGRENDQEYIYFTATGLSYIDIMLANTMYEKAAAKGIGTVLPLQAMGEFEHDLVGKIIL